MARALWERFLFSLAIAADGRRCLDESREPLLTFPNLPTIMMEEGNWDSGRLIARIVRILLEELLGYEVVLNSVSTSYGAIRRAALPELPEEWTEEDGEALKAMLDSGADFAYVVPEAWSLGRQAASIKEYSIDNDYARLAGGLGFDGRSGWYVAREFSEPPYSFEFYRAFHLDNSSMRNFLEVDNKSFAIDCSGPASCTCCQSCPGASCGCCPIPSAACDVWCPGYLAEVPSFSPLPFIKPRTYDVGASEAIIRSNRFHMAMRLWDGSLRDYEREVVDNLHSPLVFYAWTPDLLPLKLDVVRVFLPQEKCGEPHRVGNVGTWRCDFVPEQVQKLASRGLPLRAPLAWSLISAFEMSAGEPPLNSSFTNSAGAGILYLLSHLDHLRRSSAPGRSDDALVEEVACRYVRDNLITWEARVTRPVPWWAEVSDVRVVVFSLAVSACTMIFMGFVMERFWLQTGLCGKSFLHCAQRCCVRCWCGRGGKRPEAQILSFSSFSRSRRQSWLTGHGKAVLEQFVHGAEPGLDAATACKDELHSRQQEHPDRQQYYPNCHLDWATPEFHLLAPGHAQLQVRRYGDLSRTCTVRVESSDCDAQAGRHFVLLDHECTFEPGQAAASVRVDAHSVATFGRHYACPSSFYMEIVDVEGGILLRPGFKASVTISGSGRFLDVDQSSSPQRFVKRFVKLIALQNLRQFCSAVICCVYSGFHDVVVTTLTVQVSVDFIYAERMYPLVPLVVGIMILSVFLDRWTQRSFVTLSDAGPISKQLRNMIFRKFWHLSMFDHIEERNRAKWVVTMSRVSEATLAWVNVFRILAELAALGFSWLVLIIVTSQWFQVDGFSSNRATYIAVLGLALTGAAGYGIIAYSGRASHLASVVHDAELDEGRLEGQFLWSLENWSLLVSHIPRIPAVEALRLNFVQTNDDYTRQLKRANLTETTSLWINEYVTQWIMVFVLYHGIVSTIDYQHHGQGSLTIGGFYAVIKVVRSVGDAIWKLQCLLLSFTRSGELLRTIASFLDEHEVSLKQDDLCESLSSDDAPTRDSVLLKGVSFKFRSSPDAILEDCSVVIPLGFSYVVDGPPSVGKLTLMRLLLGGDSMPTQKGQVVVPPRLRTSFANGRAELIPGLGILGNILLASAGRRSLSDPGSAVELLCDALLPRGCQSCRSASSKRSSGLQSSPSESIADLFKMPVAEQREPGLTEREMCMVEIIRAILRDPDILLVNVREAPDDAWMCRVYLVLNIWQTAPGLRGLLRELEAASAASAKSREEEGEGGGGPSCCITEVALRARLEELRMPQTPFAVDGEGGSAAASAPTQRTLIVLPHSVPKLRACDVDFGFSKVIHLVDPSTCKVEEL